MARVVQSAIAVAPPSSRLAFEHSGNELPAWGITAIERDLVRFAATIGHAQPGRLQRLSPFYPQTDPQARFCDFCSRTDLDVVKPRLAEKLVIDA